MKKAKILKEERNVKVQEMQTLVGAATTEKRELTAEENVQLDGLQTEIDNFQTPIERAEKLEATLRSAAGVSGSGLGNGEEEEKQKVQKRFSLLTAFRRAGNFMQLEGAEKEINDIAIAEARGANLNIEVKQNSFNIPSSMLRADPHTVTEDAGGFGGVLAHTGPGKIIEPFLPELTLEKMGATVLTGLQGNYPLIDSAAFAFASATETETVTPQKTAYTDRIGKPTRAAAVTLISNQLLAQSAYAVEADIRKKIGNAADRKLFIDAINGSGTNEPTGLLNEAGLLVSALGAGAVDHVGIVELEGLIDDANATNAMRAYLSDPKLYSKMKTKPIDAGSGQFLMSGEGVTNGHKAFKHSDTPTLDVGVSHPLIFGDWAQLYLMIWGGFEIVVDAISKQDSNSVKMVINMHRDCLAGNPKAFAARKNFTLA